MDNWVPKLQFRHGYLVAYEQYEGPVNSENRHFKKSSRTYAGDITPGAKKRIRKCVDMLLQISPEEIIFNPVTNDYQPFSVNFITLTIPTGKKLSAKWTHKNALEPFIRVLRKKHGLKHYVWKCELQERGQIHYHLTTNRFIIWTDLRNEWNNILRRQRLMDEYILKHKHTNPNSTDVHAVHKIKNVAAYICKYVSKSVGSNPIDGKVWDASTSLKNSKHFTFEPSGREKAALSHFKNTGQLKEIIGANCTIYKPTSGKLSDIIAPDTYALYDNHIKSISRSM